MLKKIAMLLSITITLSITGCMTNVNKEGASGTDEKVTISVGDWPTENRPQWVEQYNTYLRNMESKYPDIKVVPDEWAYDVNSFVPKATSGQLPTLYETFHTETQKIINAKYCADITDELEKAGYLDKMNPMLKELVTKNGRVYGIPKDAYILGLTANVAMFTEAGLVDENGVPLFPKTYEELGEYASIIKKKTGKAGFIMPTMSNFGGWHFMSIAWSHGVTFMEQIDGKWTATFNTSEAASALQFIKDLKWKYDALPDNVLVDNPEMLKLFASDQGAMYFSNPADFKLFDTYGMKKENFSVGPMPEGPLGRFTLTGGKTYMFKPGVAPEQIDAALKWLEITGESPTPTAELLAVLDENYKTWAEEGQVVGIYPQNVWVNEEFVKAKANVIDKYKNIDIKFAEQFMNAKDVRVKPEEPMNCQELYKTLDACIQAVLTDKNADPATVINQANSDFQKNYLDKISE
ncbi:MAG: extracellular solute-binding protein [Firmicutes bacterium]|nr:extracellular solute-binding protein [Bacillota bacterium]